MASFTKKAILQTFTDMLRVMPFDKITVSALVRECGISHNTFYYHYQDIYDLLDTWLTEEVGRFVLAAGQDNWRELASSMLHCCRENKRIVDHIFDSLSRDRMERYVFTLTDDFLYRYVRKRSEGRGLTKGQIQDITEFCRYAFSGFFLKFLWNDMRDDIDAAIDKLDYLFCEFVEGAIDRAGRGNDGSAR